jgi:PAP2 superfamily
MRKFTMLFAGMVLMLTHASDAWAGSVVTRWVEQALDTVRAGNLSTPAAARLYAMTTVSMYDAVNGIDRVRHVSTREHALVPPSGAPFLGDRRAAAAAAAHAVLSALLPSHTAVLDAALAQELADLGGASVPHVALGHAWGRVVGQQTVDMRAHDGTQSAATLPPRTVPGAFRLPFTGAQFRHMTPFGVASLASYASPGPPLLTSAEYAAAFNEVKMLGSVSDTDPERAAMARHWQAEANTARETGLWFKAALQAVEEQGTVYLQSRTARLFALLGMGIADSVAASWTAKFDYHFWRPGDAIRNASTDDNPDTMEDQTWTPRNGSFGGTPEYTSGTSTFAGAAATILVGFYCQDNIAFAFAGELGTPPCPYSSFTAAADEAGRARIYNGIHFEFSNQHGREVGEHIGAEIVYTRLRRAGPCHGLTCLCPQF